MKPLLFLLLFMAAGCGPPLDDSKFEHGGEALHPDCFDTIFISNESEVDFTDCKKPEGTFAKSVDNYWEYTGTADEGFREPFSKYRILNSKGNEYLLEYMWSGGGTGVFSGIVKVKKEVAY